MPANASPSHVCDWCAGQGFEPNEESALIPCLLCNGTGYATATGDLGASRSEKRRPYSYQPGCRRLTLGTGKRAASYTVAEFSPDREFPGRAFQLVKHAGGEVYSVLVGHEGVICDCAGKTYEASGKANYRAWLEDRDQFKTLGCRHLDAVHVLLMGGWLDLPEATPTPLMERQPDYPA
jgi:hypothetical protein